MDMRASLIIAASSRTIRPFNKPLAHGIPSTKTIIARSWKLMKQGQNTALKIDLRLETRENLQAKADHYGISIAALCQAAIGYHAALWRELVEKARPKTPIDRFERSLRKESRPTQRAQKTP
jgi:hypothetical protein